MHVLWTEGPTTVMLASSCPGSGICRSGWSECQRLEAGRHGDSDGRGLGLGPLDWEAIHLVEPAQTRAETRGQAAAVAQEAGQGGEGPLGGGVAPKLTPLG